MVPPDSRREVGGLVWAKAEAVSHDCKRIYGAGIVDKWLPGTVLEVISKKSPQAKRATTYILARYKCVETSKDVAIALQSLQAQNLKPEVIPPANNNTNTNTNTNPPSGGSNNNDVTPPPPPTTTTTTEATTTTTTTTRSSPWPSSSSECRCG